MFLRTHAKSHPHIIIWEWSWYSSIFLGCCQPVLGLRLLQWFKTSANTLHPWALQQMGGSGTNVSIGLCLTIYTLLRLGIGTNPNGLFLSCSLVRVAHDLGQPNPDPSPSNLGLQSDFNFRSMGYSRPNTRPLTKWANPNEVLPDSTQPINPSYK